MADTTADVRPITAAKPAGGYCFISVVQLTMVWWAYRQQRIRLLDARTWFAAHELVARRCRLLPGYVPRYTHDELHRLVGGVGGEHVRAALRRLEAQHLLRWSPTTLTFATAPEAWPESDRRAVEAMLDCIPNHRRQVPVPRRTLRFLAGGARRVLLATLLGHLLRCLYLRQGQCVATGFCAASWIATVFGVSLRNVKLARRHLAARGWLTLVDTPHWVRTRWGQKVHLNLAWSETTVEASGVPPAPPRAAPPGAFSPSRLAPPDSYRELPQGSHHQKPATGGTPGVLLQQASGTRALTLRHITAQDLSQTERLLGLFQEAVTQRRTAATEAARLHFVATAEHVLARQARNPGGLFAALLRRPQWQVITQAEEDAARRRLCSSLDPTERSPAAIVWGDRHPGAGSSQATAAPAPLSQDALVVRTLTADLQRIGQTGNLLRLVQHHGYLPDWTPTRWEHAAQELALPRDLSTTPPASLLRPMPP